MELLEQKIQNSVTPKLIQDTVLNGDMFLNLIFSYLEAMNSDKVPEILTSLESIMQ